MWWLVVCGVVLVLAWGVILLVVIGGSRLGKDDKGGDDGDTIT